MSSNSTNKLYLTTFLIFIRTFLCIPSFCASIEKLNINISLFRTYARVMCISRPLAGLSACRIVPSCPSSRRANRRRPTTHFIDILIFSGADPSSRSDSCHSKYMTFILYSWLGSGRLHSQSPAQLFCCKYFIFFHSTVAHCYRFYNYILDSTHGQTKKKKNCGRR